ncbi:MAG: hypothetical protein AAFU85_23990 [Planctomycetota bacterium]
MIQVKPTERVTSRLGFTILEVLIALTAALLLMLGLARTYKLLGDKITERQSELDLSSRLRDVAIRLRDELRRTTSSMTPPARVSAGEGYLVYHEGPFTDSTSLLGSVPFPTPRDVTYLSDSRYGDIDDFLAFTSRAREGAPYLGFIPRGVLDAVRFANGQLTTNEIDNYNNVPNYATQLVPFYSDVAEIAYWLSPQWDRTPDPSVNADPNTGLSYPIGTLQYDTFGPAGMDYSLYPMFRDADGDLLPDNLELHRRVLLVRPDLNMTLNEMEAINGVSFTGVTEGTENTPMIPFLQGNGAGGVLLSPISNLNGTNTPVFGVNAVRAPGAWRNATDAAAQTTASPHWLTGLARLQQVMDLSVSRVIDTWSTPSTAIAGGSSFGMPTALVRCNSLAQLSSPENRFAHVRIPQELLTGPTSAPVGSSMAQIALCPPHPYLIARQVSPPALDPSDPLVTGTHPTTFPAQADHRATLPPPGFSPFTTTYGRFTMTTFLRPEFNLADRISDVGASTASTPPFIGAAQINRAGSDVIATDVVGFDIQVFDPDAPKFIWYGPDSVPGSPGDDDAIGGLSTVTDVNGTEDDTSDDAIGEMGWPGSDDELVTVNDPRIDEALVNNGNRTATDWNVTTGMPDLVESRFRVTDRGDFVDVGYPHLAGGPMRGIVQFDESGALIPAANASEFDSSFSGYTDNTTALLQTTPTIITAQSTFQPSWENSGRFVMSATTGSNTVSSFFQPVYDTWTDAYGLDAFDQEGLGFGFISASSFAVEVGGDTAAAFRESRFRQNQAPSASTPFNPFVSSRQVIVRRWSSAAGQLANEGTFEGQTAGLEQLTQPNSENPIRIEAPIPEPLQAIKITIRVNDLPAATIRQQTVIQEF